MFTSHPKMIGVAVMGKRPTTYGGFYPPVVTARPGRLIDLSRKRIMRRKLRVIVVEDDLVEAAAWAAHNCSEEFTIATWRRYGGFAFYLNNASDAVHFKLRWAAPGQAQ